jgi:hypothetical protein
MNAVGGVLIFAGILMIIGGYRNKHREVLKVFVSDANIG